MLCCPVVNVCNVFVLKFADVIVYVGLNLGLFGPVVRTFSRSVIFFARTSKKRMCLVGDVVIVCRQPIKFQ